MANKVIYAKLDLGDTLENVRSLRVKASKKLDNALEDAMEATERDMKARVPRDMGQLAASIQSTSEDLKKTIEVGAFYAPFVEFGTGLKAAKYAATLPSDWSEYAHKFRGQKSNANFDAFVDKMIGWVSRKGIVGRNGESDEELGYVIARSIMRTGVTPHPFVYPAVTKNAAKLIKRLRVRGILDVGT